MQACVSVVLPTFRRPAALREALGSVLIQPETAEIIVVDDSPEGSAQATIASLDDPRLSYLRSPVPSKGRPAVPRNLGARRAKAPYVYFLDDDDRAAPGSLKALVAELERNHTVGVAFGEVAPFGEEPALSHERRYFADAARRARRASRFRSRLLMATTLLHQATPLVCSAGLIRRDHIYAIGGFRPDVAPIEDVDFFLRAIRRFGGTFVDQVVLEYRVGHQSLMHAPEMESRCHRAHAHLASNYRQTYGELEYRALQLFARTLLKAL